MRQLSAELTEAPDASDFGHYHRTSGNDLIPTGGLFALHASPTIPAIRKVAVFDPVLFVGQPGVDEFKHVISEGKRRLASDGAAAAMASLTAFAMAGQAQRSKELVSAPYRLLGWAMTRPSFCRLWLWADARMVKGDNVALRDLIPPLMPELELVEATARTIDDYKNATAEVLLLCGAEAPPLFTATLDALANVLPNSTRVELPGLNHGAPKTGAAGPRSSPTNCAGSPVPTPKPRRRPQSPMLMVLMSRTCTPTTAT